MADSKTPPPPVIALLTDFGTHDPYVGIMKGVMLRECPNAQLVDITHEVNPQNVAQGAYLLRTAYRYFPPNTVFLCVVDPGVGTSRRAIAAYRDDGYLFIGPDNGLFTYVLDRVTDACELRPPQGENGKLISSTFHGRDIFAPYAAKFAKANTMIKNLIKYPASQFGPVVKPATLQRLPDLAVDVSVEQGADRLVGNVIHIDRFGNTITSIPLTRSGDQVTYGERTFAAAHARVQIHDTTIAGIHPTYGAVQSGDLLALISSDGQLEIAVNGGSGAARVGAKLGDRIVLYFA
jgi:S-adenosyl-L-methionine hydrolase (adenosine-forming)